MTRRLGPYAPLSATYSTDDAIIEAGEGPELLYVRGLAFCAASESDGFITRAQLKRFVAAGMDDAMGRAEALVEVGLWEEEEGGFFVRAWLKWNASAAELGRARRKDRERKAAKKPNPFQAEGPEEEETESDDHSVWNPDGIQTEGGVESDDHSEESPDGFQPHAGAHVEAHAGDSLNSTSHNSSPPAPQGGAPGLSRVERDRKFGEFWTVYPRKVGKPEARKAWDKALKAGADPDHVIWGANAYVRDPNRRNSEMKFTAHPATWLNQGRWTDEVATEEKPSGGWWDN